MKKLEFGIAAGIGDNLVIRVFFDAIKHNYDQIRVSHDRYIVDYWRNGDPNYYKFLNEMGNLLFSQPPYVFDNNVKCKNIDLDGIAKVITNLNIIPNNPNIENLCVGSSLNLNEEYIVITTKIRHISKKLLYPLLPQLWVVLREVSKKYKIVILGERFVERSKEYSVSGNIESTFGIYEQIISNIPGDRIVDLTVPCLGITAPDMTKIKQDCLIMKEAKFSIILGIGGNLWLSLVSGKTIGFRSDYLGIFTTITDLINNPNFDKAFITKDWKIFLHKLLES